MERILIVSVNWFGDCLMTTPVFKAIKDKFPAAHLGVMAPERVSGVFEDNPFIDQVIIFDENKQQKGLLAKLRFINYLKQQKFDTVFLIHRSLTRALICWLAGIKSRIGHRRLKSLLILTHAVAAPKMPLHRQDYYLSLFQDQDILVKEKIPSFFIPDKIQKQVDVSLQGIKQSSGFMVGINPSANWELKRWPAENFARVADWLIEQFKVAVIFVGAKSDQKVILRVMEKMKFPAYDFSGKTNLKQLAALIKNTSLFISNDSGPAHLAAALAVPTLVLFGPTARELTAPRGEKVTLIQKDFACPVPCYKLDCQNNKCMKDISVDEVIAAAERKIENG